MSAGETKDTIFILHSRPFQNTSLMLDVFSLDQGRISLCAKSARGPKSRFRGLLMPFSKLSVIYAGRRELKYLNKIEQVDSCQLHAKTLICGFYLNELMQAFMHPGVVQQDIFNLYWQCLLGLANNQINPALRCFEKKCLDALGFGLPLGTDAHSHKLIQPNKHYQFLFEKGFSESTLTENADVFSGEMLIDMENENFTNEKTLSEMKKCLRLVINHYLGAKQIKSRDLFDIK